MMLVNEVGPKGADKIALYSWTLHDTKGALQYLPKGALRVDESYQRDVGESDAKVLRIAREWSWVACGTIIVARRGGQYFVVDGQHRVLAALKRSDIGDLPCIVFDSADAKGEAEGFLRANRNRKPMSSMDAFKGMVTAQDPLAVAAAEIVQSGGRTISVNQSPHTVSCVGVIIDLIRKDADRLAKIWPVVSELCEGRPMTRLIIAGLFYMEGAIAPKSIVDKPIRRRLLDVGHDACMDAIGKARVFHDISNPRVWAGGIKLAYNHGLRNKLVFEGDE